MDSFYSQEELKNIGFQTFGRNVLISRKASVYGAEQISLGNNVRVDDFCILSGKIEIGNYVHIAAYSALYGGEKGIFIADFANLSSRVSVYSISDDYSGEKHVIIGSASVVLPGTFLQEGSAFGSFSFITQNSEPWSINVGIPAHKIKNREQNILVLERKMMEAVKS